MKKKIMKIPLSARLIGAVLFMFAFAFNISTFVSADESGFTLSTLKAYAATSSSAGPPPMVCGDDKCTVRFIIAAVEYEKEGKYLHCKNATSGHCSSGSCDEKCDALPTLPI
jgi:hypothetical protein